MNTIPNPDINESLQPEAVSVEPKKKDSKFYVLGLLLALILILGGILISHFLKSSSATEEIRYTEAALTFTSPDMYSREASSNSVFQVQWKVSDQALLTVPTIDLYVKGDSSECQIANDIDVKDSKFYWMTNKTCPAEVGGRYTIVARSDDTSLLGESHAITFTSVEGVTVIPFTPNTDLTFEAANLSFTVPKDIEYVYQRAQGEKWKRLELFYGTGDISISAHAYIAEWTGGVPVADLSTETVVIDGKEMVLQVHDSYVYDEKTGYKFNELEGQPFAVLIIPEAVIDSYGVLITSDYKSEEDKQRMHTFLKSIKLLP